jgi:hypothetical protein
MKIARTLKSFWLRYCLDLASFGVEERMRRAVSRGVGADGQSENKCRTK